MVTNRQPAIHPTPAGSTGHVADIAHEVIYRLKVRNSTKWLFSSSLAVCLASSITPERNTATGLVWDLTDFS
jgi:hypothetical protein